MDFVSSKERSHTEYKERTRQQTIRLFANSCSKLVLSTSKLLVSVLVLLVSWMFLIRLLLGYPAVVRLVLCVVLPTLVSALSSPHFLRLRAVLCPARRHSCRMILNIAKTESVFFLVRGLSGRTK